MTISLNLGTYEFPEFSGLSCHMMPVIQGDESSLPDEYARYGSFIRDFATEPGEIGFLTVDESFVEVGKTQRGHSVTDRFLHTEATCKNGLYAWGTYWNKSVPLNPKTKVVMCNSIDDMCMIWDDEVELTEDGNLGHLAHMYPRNSGISMIANSVHQITVSTPHECLPQRLSSHRSFVRLVGSGLNGVGPEFTVNPKMPL